MLRCKRILRRPHNWPSWGGSGQFGALNWEGPDRRDKILQDVRFLSRLFGLNHWKPDTRAKTLTFSPILSRLFGLNHWKPDTRAKTLTFSPILSRLSGRHWLPRKLSKFRARPCKKCPLRFASKRLKAPSPW
ncbi:hypothetical protein AUP71_14165 [Corynebacterium glutamicum]|nr:hypothetical protein AUP71_14165 [Corynebacterium glutamicum]